MILTETQIRNIVRKELEAQKLDEGAMDWLQGALDIGGLVPGIGEAADGLNALISLGRGNPLEAALSGISMIPAAGDAVGKGGKVVLKLLDPVMDMIKAGDKVGDIVKKIGPDKIKKAKDVIQLLKDTFVKYKPQLEKAFEVVKKADLDEVEKILDVKIPGPAREKAQELLQKASDNLNPEGVAKVVDFIAELDLGGEDSGEEEKNESYGQRGYMLTENPTILGHVMGEEYINRELRSFSKFLREELGRNLRTLDNDPFTWEDYEDVSVETWVDPSIDKHYAKVTCHSDPSLSVDEKSFPDEHSAGHWARTQAERIRNATLNKIH